MAHLIFLSNGKSIRQREGENATEETTVRVAVPTPPRTLALPRSFFVLTLTRVFPAMMSFKTLLMSALTRS
jgi:hypothetical protein